MLETNGASLVESASTLAQTRRMQRNVLASIEALAVCTPGTNEERTSLRGEMCGSGREREGRVLESSFKDNLNVCILVSFHRSPATLFTLSLFRFTLSASYPNTVLRLFDQAENQLAQHRYYPALKSLQELETRHLPHVLK